MRLRFRDAGSVRSMRGDGAPKSANPMVSASLAARRAPRGAPITAFSGNGPCFRPVRRASNAPTEPSASSWQALLVVPEGAPLPPECLVATRPAGAAPRPAFTTPHDRAPQWTRCVHHKRGLDSGDYAGTTHPPRHPGESRDPGQHAQSQLLWIPAFAGMTELLIARGCPPRSCGEARKSRGGKGEG